MNQDLRYKKIHDLLDPNSEKSPWISSLLSLAEPCFAASWSWMYIDLCSKRLASEREPAPRPKRRLTKERGGPVSSSCRPRSSAADPLVDIGGCDVQAPRLLGTNSNQTV